MSIILVPKSGEDLQSNGWNWRPTLELLRVEGVISEENYERMGAQGTGGEVDAELSHRIAETIERRLMGMRQGERMLADLTVTAKPKAKGTIAPDTIPDDLDPSDMHSASYEWLVKFADFCRRSGGFVVY